jgi:LEA14-like dessication related protein
MKYENILDKAKSPVSLFIVSFTVIVIILLLLFSPPSPQGVVVAGLDERQNSMNVVHTRVLMDNPSPYPVQYISGEYMLYLNDKLVNTGKSSLVSTSDGLALELNVKLEDKEMLNIWRDYIRDNETMEIRATYRPTSYGPIPLSSDNLSYVKVVSNNSTPVSTMIEEPINDSITGVYGNRISRENLTAFYGTEARETDKTNSFIGPEYQIRNVNVSWDYVSQTETDMKISYTVDNREPVIVPGGLVEGGIDIEYNGIEIANERSYIPSNLEGLEYDTITDTYMIPPYGRETVIQTVKIDNRKILEAAKSHLSLRNESKLSVRSRLIKGFDRKPTKIPKKGQLMFDCSVEAKLNGISNQSCRTPNHVSSVKVVPNSYRDLPLSNFDRVNDIPEVGSVSFVQNSDNTVEARASAYDSDGVITSYTWYNDGIEKRGRNVKLNQESKNETYELTVVDDDDFRKVIEYNVNVSDQEVDYDVQDESLRVP